MDVRLFGGLRKSDFVAAVVMVISGLPEGSHRISLVYLDIKYWNFYSTVIRREPVSWLPLLAPAAREGGKHDISFLWFLFAVQCASSPCCVSPTMGPGTKCSFFLFLRVSTTMCSLGCQRTSSVDQADLKLRRMHLPLSPSAGIKAMHHTGSSKCS